MKIAMLAFFIMGGFFPYLAAQDYAQILHNTMWADFLYYDKQHTYATTWYEKNLHNDGAIPYPLRSYSLLLFDMHQFKSLLTYKNQLQSHFQDDIQIQKIIALSLAHEKNSEEAAKIFFELSQKFPTSYDVVLPAAQILIQQGKLKESKNLLEKIINTRMQKNVTPAGMVLLAQIHLKENNFDAAHALITQCITYQPSYAPAWLILGALEEFKNNTTVALNAYRTFVTHSPVRNQQIEEHIKTLSIKHATNSTQPILSQSYAQQALTLLIQQKYTAALHIIKSGLYKNKNDIYLRALYIHALVATLAYPTALVTIAQYIQEKPTDHTWWGTLHLLALHPNIEKKAYETLKSVRLRHPHILWGYLYEADYALRRKNYTEAHTLYTQGHYIAHNDALRAELYFMQALCGYELNDYTLVAQAVQRGLRCSCVHAPLYNLAAYYYAHSTDYKKAGALIVECCKLEPDNHHYKDTAAFIVYKKGDFALAEKIYTQLQQAHPTDATISLHAAQLAQKQNNSSHSFKLLAHAKNHAYSKYEKRRIKARLLTGKI